MNPALSVATVHPCRALSGVATFGARLAALPSSRFRAVPVLLSARAADADAFADTPAAITPINADHAPPHERILALRDALAGFNVVVPCDSPEGSSPPPCSTTGRAARSCGTTAAGTTATTCCRAPLADAWTAVSAPLRAHVRSLGLCPAPEASTEPLPVCVGVRSEPPKGPPVARTLRLFYAGRLENAHKRVLDLVRLADALAARAVRFFLTIAGDGPARAQLARAFADRGHNGRVMFTGALPPYLLHEMYSAHDFTVLVSRNEGWPLVVAESLAGGRPVAITTGCGGAPDLVRREGCGVVANTGDMNALAAGLAPFAEDREGLARLNAAALHAARTTLCPGVLLPAYEAALFNASRAPARYGANSADNHAPLHVHWRRMLDALQAVPGADTATARALRDAWLADLPVTIAHDALPLESDPVPVEASIRLAHAAQSLRAAGAQRIALFGAGTHTRRLSRWLDRCGPFAAIIDERAGQDGAPDILMGLPVVHPSRLGSLRIDAVILSSDEHESAMIEAAASWRWRGPVVALYDTSLSLGARSSVSA